MNSPLSSSPQSAANPTQPVNPSATAPSSNGHSSKPHRLLSKPLEDQEDGYMGNGTPHATDICKPTPKEREWEKKFNRHPRPYFVPSDFMWSSLPEDVKEAVFNIVVPSYEELGLGAATALERQAGLSLSFILFLEILDQYEIGHQVAGQLGRGAFGQSEDRQKHISQYLRLVHSKQHVANFLLRLQTLKSQSPSGAPMLGMGG